MKKQAMKGGLQGIFGDQPQRETDIPQTGSTNIPERKTPKKPYSRAVTTKKDDGIQRERFSIITEVTLHEIMHEIAYWERTTITEIINEELQKRANAFIKANGGERKPIPPGKLKGNKAYDK
jgi:hypothetical protein